MVGRAVDAFLSDEDVKISLMRFGFAMFMVANTTDTLAMVQVGA